MNKPSLFIGFFMGLTLGCYWSLIRPPVEIPITQEKIITVEVPIVTRKIERIVQFIDVCESEPKIVEKFIETERHHENKFKLNLYVGYAPVRIKTTRALDSLKIKTEHDIIFGIGLGRDLNEDIGVSIIGTTNNSLLGGLEVRF